MNKTRYKIATLTGSAVMAAMLLSLLILNKVFNKKKIPPMQRSDDFVGVNRRQNRSGVLRGGKNLHGE